MTDNPSSEHARRTNPSGGCDRPQHLEPELLAHILEVSPISIAVISDSGRIAFANERALELLSVTHEEIIGRTYADGDWNIYHDDGTPVSFENHPVTTVLETGEPAFGYEHWIELEDGTERWIVNNAAPILTDDGLECVVVTFEDATAMKEREEKLTSDHVRLVEIRAGSAAIPPSLREVNRSTVHITVDSVVSLPDGSTVQYMTTADLSKTKFVTAVTEVDHYRNVRLLRTTDEHTYIEAHAEPSTVSSVFPALGGSARAIIITDEEIQFRGELPGDVDPKAAVSEIRAFHDDARLVSQELVYSPHLLYSVVEEALTDRQFATLEAAYYGGYFSTPRQSTGDELAARFGVTRQTFNTHLRKAESIVFQHLFEKSAADAR